MCSQVSCLWGSKYTESYTRNLVYAQATRNAQVSRIFAAQDVRQKDKQPKRQKDKTDKKIHNAQISWISAAQDATSSQTVTVYRASVAVTEHAKSALL